MAREPIAFFTSMSETSAIDADHSAAAHGIYPAAKPLPYSAGTAEHGIAPHKHRARTYSARRRFLGRPASNRSNSAFGNARNNRATMAICHGITR